MKFRLSIAMVLAGGVASAQPAPAPAPPPDQPQPTDAGEPPPSWLPGVQDVTAAEIATPGKLTITMARAVELAIRQHPTLRIARAQTEAAYGRVDQAGVPLHPTLKLSGTLGAANQPYSPASAFLGTSQSGGFFTIEETNALSAIASWTITDFGLTKANVHAAELSAEAQRAGEASSGLDVRQAVELAYLQAIATRRLVIVAEATVKSEAGHLDQAKRFVAAQAHDPIEVAQATSREANAKSALAQAQANEAVALATLRASIGWIDPTRAPEVDPNWPIPSEAEPPQLAALVDTARKARPDLIQLDRQIAAAEASLDAAHYERRPTLSATASVIYGSNSETWSSGPVFDAHTQWLAGLTLSWLAWDGGKSAADVRVAKANVAVAAATRDGLLVTLTSQLESARAQIISNRAAVQAATEAVAAANAQLKLAEGRYAAGVGSQIELADAQTAVTTAQGNLVSSEWQLADAWASLRRQLGA